MRGEARWEAEDELAEEVRSCEGCGEASAVSRRARRWRVHSSAAEVAMFAERLQTRRAVGWDDGEMSCGKGFVSGTGTEEQMVPGVGLGEMELRCGTADRRAAEAQVRRR